MSEPKKPKKPAKKQVIDVSEPGETAPSSTSKPVIVTNRPILQDPMVVEDSANQPGDQPVDKPADRQNLKRTGTATVQPLSAPPLPGHEEDNAADEPVKAKPETKKLKPDAAEAEKPEEATIAPDEPDDQQPAEPAAPAPQPEAEEPEKEAVGAEPADDQAKAAEPEAAAEKSSMADTPAGATGQDKPKDKQTDAEKKLEAEAAEQAKHDAAIQQLIDSRKYELPLNAVEKRKTKRFVVLGIFLAILLVLAWADIALDAGIVHVSGVKPVTHFFSN